MRNLEASRVDFFDGAAVVSKGISSFFPLFSFSSTLARTLPGILIFLLLYCAVGEEVPLLLEEKT